MILNKGDKVKSATVRGMVGVVESVNGSTVKVAWCASAIISAFNTLAGGPGVWAAAEVAQDCPRVMVSLLDAAAVAQHESNVLTRIQVIIANR